MVASYNAAFANLISALGPYLSQDCFFFVDFQRSSLLPHACVSAMPMCLRKAEKEPRLQSCYQGGYSPWYGPIMSAICPLDPWRCGWSGWSLWHFGLSKSLRTANMTGGAVSFQHPPRGWFETHNISQSTATNRPFFWCIFMHVQLCYFWTWRLWFSTPLSNGADCEKFQSAACTNTDGFLMPIWRPSTFTEVACQFYNMGHAMGSTSNLAFVLPESLPRLVTTRQSTRTGHFRNQSWAILDDF